MHGYSKIKWTCEQAVKDGFKYAWVDTCCINKESSAELSEAINSMFQWYKNAAICYVYLSDLEAGHISTDRGGWTSRKNALSGCKWFSRGWTLQELLVPKTLLFFDAQWKLHMLLKKETAWHKEQPLEPIGILSDITGIEVHMFKANASLNSFAVATRLSWAARRETTRLEDKAYCLLGLLDVNMPLLYGEGARAFARLQEEVLRKSSDLSILCWEPYDERQARLLLAPDCYCFRNEGGSRHTLNGGRNVRPMSLSNAGLQLSLFVNNERSLALLGHSHTRLVKANIDQRRLVLNIRAVPGAANAQDDAEMSDTFEVMRYPSSRREWDRNIFLTSNDDESFKWVERAGPMPYLVSRHEWDEDDFLYNGPAFLSKEVILLKSGVSKYVLLELSPELEVLGAGEVSVSSQDSVAWYPDDLEMIYITDDGDDHNSVKFFAVRNQSSGSLSLVLFRRYWDSRVCAWPANKDNVLDPFSSELPQLVSSWHARGWLINEVDVDTLEVTYVQSQRADTTILRIEEKREPGEVSYFDSPRYQGRTFAKLTNA